MANPKRQIYNALGKKKAFGQSRQTDKQKAKNECKQLDYYTRDKIYSQSTFNNYVQFNQRLLKYAQERGDISDIRQLQSYVEPYLNGLIDKGVSAWTVSSYLSAFNKLLDTTKEDYPNLKDYSREINDIKKNRGNSEIRYNPENYKAELTFARCFGLRDSELGKLYIGQVKIKDDVIQSVYVKQGKGGRSREVKFYGTKEEHDFILKDLKEKKSKGYKKLFPSFTRELKVHEERQKYAIRVYKHHARDVSQLDKKDIVIPRKGPNAGVKYDRQALSIASKALGHSRLNVIYNHYV